MDFLSNIGTAVPIFSILRYSIGTPLFLITAVSPAPTQFTKLTLSLRKLSQKTSAGALRHKFAGNFQVRDKYSWSSCLWVFIQDTKKLK